jgi:hypothetical protein
MNMKNVKFILSLMLVAMIATVSTVFQGCSDDDEPAALTLTSLTAGDTDLNGATSATDIPTDAVITAEFSTDVDETTANATNVTLTRDYDDAVLPVTVTTAGNTVTITPDETMGTGSLYILNISGLKSTGGKTLTTAIERNFTTEGTFAPAGVLAYYTFENSAEDVADGFDPTASDVVDITYTASRTTAAGMAASFNGTTSLIEIPNASSFMTHDDFAISFWIKPTYTVDKGQFVLGLAAWKGFQFEIFGGWDGVKFAMQYDQGDGTTDAEDSWFPGNGQTKDNGGWQGWTVHKDVSGSGGVGETYFKDKWVHVVMSYNATTKVNSLYLNGEKVKEHDFNLWPSDSKKKNIVGVAYAGNAAPADELALGFIQARDNRTITDDWANYAITTNNHYMGLMDDLRIFSVPLTQTEVTLMYNSEKP